MDFSWIYNLNHQLATLLLAMLPITELRASIPIALKTFSLPIWQAFSLSILGSFIPAVLIIYFIGPISQYFQRFKWGKKFFDWLFERTRKRFDKKYYLWGKIALLIFVAIPLPLTGVWTGSLAAWLFAFEKKQALLFIFLGTILAAVFVTLISLGFFKIFEFLL